MKPQHAAIKMAIIEYIQKHGYPPTVREIAKMTGYKSVSSVQGHLVKMFELGILETDKKTGRIKSDKGSGIQIRNEVIE